MKDKPIKVVIDTNIWISFLISRTYFKLDNLVKELKILFVFSDELLTEFLNVVQRPKFKKFFTKSDVKNILLTIDSHALFIDVNTEINICRDVKDNFLLALAIDGKADFLITGDADLLVLKKYKNITILTITDFLSKY